MFGLSASESFLSIYLFVAACYDLMFGLTARVSFLSIYLFIYLPICGRLLWPDVWVDRKWVLPIYPSIHLSLYVWPLAMTWCLGWPQVSPSYLSIYSSIYLWVTATYDLMFGLTAIKSFLSIYIYSSIYICVTASYDLMFGLTENESFLSIYLFIYLYMCDR